MEIENGSSKGRYNVILEKEADPSGRSPLLRVELITDYPEMSKIQDPRSKIQDPKLKVQDPIIVRNGKIASIVRAIGRVQFCGTAIVNHGIRSLRPKG